MSEKIPEQEAKAEKVTLPVKKTRTVKPGGKKRGPKAKPVTKTIRVRDMEEETPRPTYPPEPTRVLSFDELCEYVEITVMEDPSDGREVTMNNGCNRPLVFIRGHKCIIPKPYLDTLTEINAIPLLKHEFSPDGSQVTEYNVPLLKYNFIVHRTGLTYADYDAQMKRFKELKDPWGRQAWGKRH